jgi:hypothetical protein
MFSICIAEISFHFKSTFSKNIFVEEAGIEPAHMALQAIALPLELFFHSGCLMALASATRQPP